MTAPKSLLNLKGQVFGFLTVVRITNRRHKNIKMWQCLCVCGTKLVVRHDYLLRAENPKNHCGCKNRGLPTQFPQEYHIHNSMLRRCYVKNHVGYPSYGGRGIEVCEAWKTSFETFLKDVGPRPSPLHSLDRKDSNGNYEPSNIKWSTRTEQSRNKRQSIFLPHPTMPRILIPAAEVAEILQISYQAMRTRYIKEGKWPTKLAPEG